MAKKKKEEVLDQGQEFLKAVNGITKEKGIDPEVVYSAMELARQSAYKKNFNTKSNVKVLINRDTGEIKVYSYLTVVPDDKMTREEYEDKLFESYSKSDDIDADKTVEEEKEEEKEMDFFNPVTDIKLTDAKKLDKKLEVGDTIDTEVTPHDFGRVAASTAKHRYSFLHRPKSARTGTQKQILRADTAAGSGCSYAV